VLLWMVLLVAGRVSDQTWNLCGRNGVVCILLRSIWSLGPDGRPFPQSGRVPALRFRGLMTLGLGFFQPDPFVDVRKTRLPILKSKDDAHFVSPMGRRRSSGGGMASGSGLPARRRAQYIGAETSAAWHSWIGRGCTVSRSSSRRTRCANPPERGRDREGSWVDVSATGKRKWRSLGHGGHSQQTDAVSGAPPPAMVANNGDGMAVAGMYSEQIGLRRKQIDQEAGRKIPVSFRVWGQSHLAGAIPSLGR